MTGFNLSKRSLTWMLVLVVTSVLVECVTATDLDEELSITYEQKMAIDKLRNRVIPYITEPYMKEDLHLLRWLRVANFNVNEAQRLVLEDIKWRKQAIEAVEQEDFEEFVDYFPYLFTTDKQGQPTFIGYAGEWDLRNAVITGRSFKGIRYLTKAIESGARMIRKMQQAGKNVTRLNVIVDLDGFNIAQHGCPQCLLRLLDFVNIYNRHYPGLADKALFINAPPSIAAASQVIRLNSFAETMKAIQVYGKDKNVWQKALLSFMDRDQLPVEFGGTKPRSSFQRELDL